MSSDEDIVLIELYKLSQQKHRRKQCIWTHDIIGCRCQFGEYNRLLQELRLDSDRFLCLLPSDCIWLVQTPTGDRRQILVKDLQ